MTGLPRLAFGTAVLTAERLTGRRTSPASPVAVVVGLSGAGRDDVTSLAGLRRLVRDAGTRGAISMVRSRRAAQARLTALVDESLTWMIDRTMPQVKEKIIPVIVEDLADDPKVRGFVADFVREQSQGMVADATLELRETSASADDRVESAFRQMFRNGSGR